MRFLVIFLHWREESFGPLSKEAGTSARLWPYGGFSAVLSCRHQAETSQLNTLSLLLQTRKRKNTYEDVKTAVSRKETQNPYQPSSKAVIRSSKPLEHFCVCALHRGGLRRQGLLLKLGLKCLVRLCNCQCREDNWALRREEKRKEPCVSKKTNNRCGRQTSGKQHWIVTQKSRVLVWKLTRY